MDSIPNISELWSLLRRRLVIFSTVIGIGLMLSLFYALSLPRIYESTAVIQIQNSPVSESLAVSQSSARVMQQLQRTEQRLMARDHLIYIIKKHNLFADRSAATMSDKVFWLRLAVDIEQITNPLLQWRTDITPTALTIKLRLGDPEQVAAVTNELVASVLEQNKSRRAERVSEALQFFTNEELRVGEEIAGLDAEIETYKLANAEFLPEAVAGSRGQLVSLSEADLLLEQKLIELTAGGAALLRPLVAKQIEELEKQRSVIAARRLAIKQTIDRAPTAEKQINILTRRLALLEEQFTVIARHLAEAKMGQMLESSRQSDNFEVLEFALVPESPVGPSRKKILLMGIISSIAAAIGLIYLLEMWHPVIRSTGQLERLLKIKAVVAIPVVETRTEVTRRWVTKVGVLILFAIGVPLSLLMVNAFVLPLDGIFDTAVMQQLSGRF